jgi:hypothetical protein
MTGIDPYAYLEKLAMNMDQLQTRTEIETVLGELACLVKTMPADLLETAEKMAALLQTRLREASD